MPRSRKCLLRLRCILIVTFYLVCFSGRALPLLAQAPATAPQTRRLVELKLHSAALEGNRLGDPADQSVAVYLPPTYETSPTQRFPTLYLLHGFDGNIEQWTTHGYQGMTLQDTMDALIEAGTIREMIVVVPNG